MMYLSQVIWRIDDVSPNTDMAKLRAICGLLRKKTPGCAIWLGISIFGRREWPQESVYPNPPFKDRPLEWFCAINSAAFLDLRSRAFSVGWEGREPLPTGALVIASHGLIHADHSRLSEDAQAMSILTSCSLLQTRIFIPPFCRYDFHTEGICEASGIFLAKRVEHGWKSIECNSFNPLHDRWYLHPWRWTVGRLKEYLQCD